MVITLGKKKAKLQGGIENLFTAKKMERRKTKQKQMFRQNVDESYSQLKYDHRQTVYLQD